MSEQPTALSTLSTQLCPWLRPMLSRLMAARATGRLGHAWLLAGPAGVGKINLALTFANRLLGGPHTPPPALGAAEAIAAIRERHSPADHHPDLHWLFPEEDKRTISVEQIRTVCEALALKPHRGPAKVVVIEPAEGLTTGAANALLKTLEEPAGDAYLLLVSHQPGRLPATIRSRCQRINIARPKPRDVRPWLATLAAPDAVLELLSVDSPLAVASLLQDGMSRDNSELERFLILVSQDKIDPQAVADNWFKLDYELILSWLIRRLQLCIRARMAANRSTGVTDPSIDALHNAWGTLTLRTLFHQHQAAEQLLSQVGAGTNVELALRALLLGFQPNRGPS